VFLLVTTITAAPGDFRQFVVSEAVRQTAQREVAGRDSRRLQCQLEERRRGIEFTLAFISLCNQPTLQKAVGTIQHRWILLTFECDWGKPLGN
jgi:hypothetical protein